MKIYNDDIDLYGPNGKLIEESVPIESVSPLKNSAIREMIYDIKRSAAVNLAGIEKGLKSAAMGGKSTYIPGRELSVAVLDGQALGVVELVPKHGWYDFQNKYQAGAVQHLLPAPVEAGIEKKLCQYAEKIHTVLGCRGVSRSDFRLDKNKIVFLEINTNPGMTPTSLVPDMARLKNLSYADLIEQLIQGAQCD